MTDSRVALDPDRLPWLTSDSRPRTASGWSLLASWVVVVLFLVAGLSYWLGRTTDIPFEPEAAVTGTVRETVRLPDPAPAAPAPVADPAPKIELTPAPVVEPARAEPVAASEPVRKTIRKARPAKVKKATVTRAKARARPARSVRRAPTRRVAAWPTPAAAVSLGRMIHTGTYSSQAKTTRAWQSVLRRYPQTRGLPKVVVPYRANDGKYYYRLMFMTTAAAQSQWLCRKMRSHWRRCSVVR